MRHGAVRIDSQSGYVHIPGGAQMSPTSPVPSNALPCPRPRWLPQNKHDSIIDHVAPIISAILADSEAILPFSPSWVRNYLAHVCAYVQTVCTVDPPNQAPPQNTHPTWRPRTSSSRSTNHATVCHHVHAFRPLAQMRARGACRHGPARIRGRYSVDLS